MSSGHPVRKCCCGHLDILFAPIANQKWWLCCPSVTHCSRVQINRVRQSVASQVGLLCPGTCLNEQPLPGDMEGPNLVSLQESSEGLVLPHRQLACHGRWMDVRVFLITALT